MKSIVAAVLACAAAMAVAQEPSSSQAVRIEVDPQTVLGVIPEDFIGFGYETSALARGGFFSAKNTHMVQLYRTLGTHGLVRIGGIIGDHTRFEPEGALIAETLTGKTVINQTALTDLAGFLQATGWKVLWTLNLGTGSREEAVQEALAVHAALGDRLHSFEIGNEVDNLKRFDGYESYHTAYLDYKAAIRAALPDAVFSGPDSAGKADWTLAFALTEWPDMKLLLHHYYRSGAKSPEATMEALLLPHPKWETTLSKLHEACAGKNIAFRINEVNSFSGGGKAGVSDTFASALWCLDFMFRVAAHGGAGVNMETDVNQIGFVSHYSPIFREEDGRLTARPEYYGMLAFSLAAHGSLVKLTTSEISVNLSAYATKDADGTLWITLVNKDVAQAAKITLQLPETCTIAEPFRLTAPSAQSKSEVTLGGVEISPQGTWAPASPEPIPILGGRFPVSLALPAASAVLLRVRL